MEKVYYSYMHATIVFNFLVVTQSYAINEMNRDSGEERREESTTTDSEESEGKIQCII